MRALTSAAIAIALSTGALGCGGDGSDSPESDSGLPAAGGGGTLRYAIPEVPRNLDPLQADTRAERLVARQVYEPLVSSVRAPYAGERSPNGLAATITPSQSRAEWTIVVRPGVRFQDGSDLDSATLLENARRWIAGPRAGELLPGAFGADSPRPGAVRLLFTRPTPDVRTLLAAPELGLVSSGPGREGTGPFRPGPRAEGSLTLTRNGDWWGSGAGLGPALDSVSFVGEPNSTMRATMLEAGTVQVTEPAGTFGLAAVSANPLLRAEGGRLGIARSASVRGLADPPVVPQLSAVWLTNIGD